MKLEDVLKNIADFTDDPIIITDGSDIDAPFGPKIVYINKAFTRMTGYTPEDIVGQTPRILQGPETDAAALAEIRAALQGGTPLVIELLNYRKSGEPFLVEVSLWPMAEKSDGIVTSPSFFLAVQRDVTERSDRSERLVEAPARADNPDQAKRNFLARMSHELRTPLNAILGFAEMINNEILGPIAEQRYVHYAGDIHISALHLLGIVDDLLDFSKIEAGKVDLDETEFDIAELIGEVYQIMRIHCERGQIVWTVNQADAFIIRADLRLMRQVILNLVSNAITFTDPGGIISLSCLRLADGRFACVINDTGTGLPFEKSIDVLDPYVSLRTEGSRKRRPGTGLGLPIAKSFMQLHGGDLFINSELGAGTSVFLTLPSERIVSANAVEMPTTDDVPILPARESLHLGAEEIETLSDAEIDRLPIGVMLLDADGTVLRFNATEARFSGLEPNEAIGKKFFTEIAPCTRFSAFRETFKNGVEAGTLNSTLSYTFAFPGRPMRVLIQLKAAKQAGFGWVFTRWV